MKIKSVNIKYFKFHQDLTLNLDSKNCLIYGENGSGKSSIYDALYSNFYQKKRRDKLINVNEFYQNRDFITKDIEVNILLDNNEYIKRKGNTLTGIDNLVYETGAELIFDKYPSPTFYFANERVLNRLVKENFYIALQDTLTEHFSGLEIVKSYFNDFKNIDRLKKKAIEDIEKSEDKPQKEILDLVLKIRQNIEKRLKNANKDFKISFNHNMPLKEINNIIQEHFQEDFKITFQIKDEARFEATDELIFRLPEIRIIIDDLLCPGKLNNHFNEAKLKLISIAIYFACAKKYEEHKTKGFKLLVLDDFLTSLDMANRKLIIQYILQEFKDYQKIILTHNLQFFNLIIKMLTFKEEANLWNLCKLFIFENKSFIHNKDINYLEEAHKLLKMGDIQSSGNYIRKEFERIITEFEQLLQLGRVEDLQNIIDVLKSSDKHYIKSKEQISNTINSINTIINSSEDEDNIKINKIKTVLRKMEKSEIDFNEKDLHAEDKITSYKTIIKKGEFYKNFILNSASHDDGGTEIYKKECDNAIKLLKYMNLIIKNLKGTKYH